MNFNLGTHFKPWKRSDVKPNELANYDSFTSVEEFSDRYGRGKSLRDVVVVFDSADSLAEHFFHNVKEAGGNGTWNTGSSGIYSVKDFQSHDSWRFGKHFPTFEKTMAVLKSGNIPIQYLRRLEEKKHELYQKYPELYNLQETAVVKKRRRRFSEDGDELDIDRYMVGDPAMWSSMPKQDANKKCATFFIDVAVSSGTEWSEIMNGVIDSVALVDIVEKAGIPTEVIIGGVTYNGTTTTRMLTVACKAKHAEEPLDVSRVLSFCLPGFYRSLLFCAWENVSEGRQDAGGLGTGDWSFGGNYKDYFNFFNAIVKTRPKDYYWNSNAMEVNINNIKNYLQ